MIEAALDMSMHMQKGDSAEVLCTGHNNNIVMTVVFYTLCYRYFTILSSDIERYHYFFLGEKYERNT